MWDAKGPHLTPRLTKIFYRPGTNHITNDMDLTEMRMRYEADGWRFIPFSLASKVDKSADSYLQRVQVPGGYAYLERWCRVVPGTGRLMPDSASWLKFLKAVGRFVDAAPAYALDDLKAQYVAKRSSLARQANMLPDADDQIARCNDAIKLIDKELKKAEARDMQSGEEVTIDASE